MINPGNIEAVVVDQITRYYPRRLGDYKAGLISVKIHIIQGNGDDEWYDYLKKQTSITDPACTLIMGFNEATLFLQRFMVDPL